MRRRPELMQLEIGMSTSRYLTASGTAGLARSLVRGKRRLPCPPPMITESTLLELTDWRPVCDIANPEVRSPERCPNYTRSGGTGASGIQKGPGALGRRDL